MVNEETYNAMRAYIRLCAELEAKKAMTELRSSLPTETRAAEPVVGPAGKDGVSGKDGTDGKDGAPGERGTNGIATLEDLTAVAKEIFADFQVRTFADVHQGVYKPGQAYTRGQIVTWGGSLWLALTDTKAKPGEGPDWKLVVKK